MTDLFNNQTTNGNSSWVEVGGSSLAPSHTGDYVVEMSGFAAGTVKLQYQDGAGAAVDIPDTSKTADTAFTITLGLGSVIRANAASVSGDALYVTIRPTWTPILGHR